MLPLACASRALTPRTTATLYSVGRVVLLNRTTRHGAGGVPAEVNRPTHRGGAAATSIPKLSMTAATQVYRNPRASFGYVGDDEAKGHARRRAPFHSARHHDSVYNVNDAIGLHDVRDAHS